MGRSPCRRPARDLQERTAGRSHARQLRSAAQGWFQGRGGRVWRGRCCWVCGDPLVPERDVPSAAALNWLQENMFLCLPGKGEKLWAGNGGPLQHQVTGKGLHTVLSAWTPAGRGLCRRRREGGRRRRGVWQRRGAEGPAALAAGGRALQGARTVRPTLWVAVY